MRRSPSANCASLSTKTSGIRNLQQRGGRKSMAPNGGVQQRGPFSDRGKASQISKAGLPSFALLARVASRKVRPPEPTGAPVDALPRLAEIAGVFVLAGAVKGMIGMGLPTVAIGILGLFMTPAEAAAVLVLPTLVTNIWQAAAGRAFLRL